MEDIEKIERQLQQAQERLRQALAAFSTPGGGLKEWDTADQEVLRLERRLAAAKGEEYAERLAFPVKWDIGAPLPHLMRNDYRALLAFLVSEPDPNWDGTYITVKSPADAEPEPLALVEFEGCISAKLGSPNDEVHSGHPLCGKGLECYTAQEVVNSRWLKEVQAINSVHHMYRPENWVGLHHYVFWFHDTTFECLADSFKVETHRVSVKELLTMMIERLIA